MGFIINVFIGLTIAVVIYIRSRDRGSKEPASMLWAAAAFGLLAIALAVPLELLLTSIDAANLEKPLGITAGAFYDGFAVGIIEELAKFLPLALFIYKKRYFNEHTDGILYFGLAGIGFGLPENILYTLDGGAGTGIGRLILTPFFHAATTSFVGYYLARHKLRGGSWRPVIVALAAMIVAHGYYDFGLMTGVVALVLSAFVTSFALTGTFFWLIVHAQHEDQKLGISTVGVNTFCRSCGSSNPKHNLYCYRCGNHT
ncbi:PrsW family intramembrane metalloprotease [Candidatus Saccharibacteria bacterium]|nr:PrsW family intramembrane metalloprotease [Candidatus Saccharibacteria bacterium]